jgi:hypothetical protein
MPAGTSVTRECLCERLITVLAEPEGPEDCPVVRVYPAAVLLIVGLAGLGWSLLGVEL